MIKSTAHAAVTTTEEPNSDRRTITQQSTRNSPAACVLCWTNYSSSNNSSGSFFWMFFFVCGVVERKPKNRTSEQQPNEFEQHVAATSNGDLHSQHFLSAATQVPRQSAIAPSSCQLPPSPRIILALLQLKTSSKEQINTKIK